jgi:DNA polymerase elongation subunit (family B)
LVYRKRNLSYAAIISAKARIKLNASLNLVLKSGGRLYYTDTDSIFAGYKENRINETMGDIT